MQPRLASNTLCLMQLRMTLKSWCVCFHLLDAGVSVMFREAS